jgi:hypothetical protein
VGLVPYVGINPDLDFTAPFRLSIFQDGVILNYFIGANYKGLKDKEISFGFDGRFSASQSGSTWASENRIYLGLGFRTVW